MKFETRNKVTLRMLGPAATPRLAAKAAETRSNPPINILLCVGNINYHKIEMYL